MNPIRDIAYQSEGSIWEDIQNATAHKNMHPDSGQLQVLIHFGRSRPLFTYTDETESPDDYLGRFHTYRLTMCQLLLLPTPPYPPTIPYPGGITGITGNKGINKSNLLREKK